MKGVHKGRNLDYSCVFYSVRSAKIIHASFTLMSRSCI